MSSSYPPVRYELFVGIDIAAATASAAWQTSEKKPSKAITIEQTPEGFTILQRSLLLTHVAPGQVLVVMEAERWHIEQGGGLKNRLLDILQWRAFCLEAKQAIRYNCFLGSLLLCSWCQPA